jgi:Phage integrase family
VAAAAQGLPLLGHGPLQHAAFAHGADVVPVDGGAPSTSATGSAARLRGLCEAGGARALVLQVVGPAHLERLLPVIDAIQPDTEPSGPLFRGKRGPYTVRGVEYLVARLGRRAEVEGVHPHRFRHDTARRLVQATDLPTVAAWLGHERLDTVRIYSQPDEAALERAAAALEAG